VERRIEAEKAAPIEYLYLRDYAKTQKAATMLRPTYCRRIALHETWKKFGDYYTVRADIRFELK